jgi:hypothetical protein
MGWAACKPKLRPWLVRKPCCTGSFEFLDHTGRPDDAYPLDTLALDTLAYAGEILLEPLEAQELLCSQARHITSDVEYPAGEHTPPKGSAMDPPARIVLVEDESITALGVARRLRRLGYQVAAQANSGPQA